MTRVSQTRPGHGSGCPWVRVRVTVTAPVTRAQPISKATANRCPQQPTKANAGPRRQKRAQTTRRVVWAIGRSFLLIYILFSIFLLLQSPRGPTAANEGQCRPTKMKKGPNDVVWALDDK